MAITVSCPECDKSLKLSESTLGKKVKCPACAGVFVVKADQPARDVGNVKSVPSSRLGSAPSLPFEAYAGARPFMFVSYCHRDKAFVYAELERLHKKGFRIWYDEGITPGKEWPEEIEDALSRAAFFVVFVSPRAMSSENVRNEINFALRRSKPFLAIHIEETELVKGMGLQMEARQAIHRHELDESLFARRLEACLPGKLREE